MQRGLILWFALAAAVCPGQAVQSVESQRQSALALEQQGKNAEAETIWRAFLKQHPVDPEPYAHLGLIEAQQEHYKEAVPLYRKALSLSPSTPELRLNLGLALFKAGEMKEAIRLFQPLLKNQPPSSSDAQRLTILLGMAHYALGDFAEASPYLKQAAARDPQNLGLRLSLAHSCLWSKQYKCVLDTYHEILLLNAESAEADILAGEALDELKDHGGAIKQFRAAVQANPNEPDVHFGLGYLLWTQRQYEEAASELQAELTNNPNQVQALLYLGDAQMQMSHPEAALPILEQVERVDPTLSLGHLDLGILYADAGRNEDALREMNVARKLTPNDVNVHWRLGRLYRAMGKKDEAKAELNKASSLTKATDEALINKMNGGGAKAKSGGAPTKGAGDALPER
ncbi:MAG: tetratricopeptide repeat protein [Terracidiphilus sp.]|nr:tetratricopeptide repeat protein [Terracidiphilus sp.]MDR3776176.1 tetratricopeptide repeat protein [Terracidiphilus sp.]